MKNKRISSGGNANVYFREAKKIRRICFEQLYQTSKERRVRFVDEINIIKDNLKK